MNIKGKILVSTIEKPCIKKCTLNEEDICMGCFRTFDDMLKWHKSSLVKKEEIIDIAKSRQIEHQQLINSLNKTK